MHPKNIGLIQKLITKKNDDYQCVEA